jgi:8-oxo-dGTP pyrophosphatase MutT (NUDIX family)
MSDSADNSPAHRGSVPGPGGLPDPTESPWRTLAAREVYRNPWLDVTEYTVLRPDGTRGIYGVVDPGPNATVLALDAQERVYLIGEWLYPLGRYDWHLPTGKVEAGEDPLVAARRELAEEAGLEAGDWTPLGVHPLSGGILAQVSHTFLARDLQRVVARPEGTEQIELRTLSLRDAVSACLLGEISSASAVLSIWHAWFLLHGDTLLGGPYR